MLETTRADQSNIDVPEMATQAAQPRSHASISVAELCSKKVAVDWAEAIAISQGVCNEINAMNADGIRVDTHNVFIDADGSVTVTPATRPDPTSVVQQVSDVLRALLPEENVPSPLRSVLFHPPAGSSLEAWRTSVEYYERQNRSSHIQAVYERAVNATVRMTLTHPAVPVPVAAKTRDGKTPASVSERRLAVLGIAILAILVAGVAATVMMIQAGLLEPGRASVMRRGNSVNARRRINQGAPVPSAAGATLEGTPAEVAQDATAQLPSDVVAPLIMPAVNELARLQSASIIYSESDEDVVPPAPIDPRFPSAIPSGTKLDEFAEFEVLVTASGGVESVKARRVPATMAEAVSMTMSLSAAKTWRFHPALKDGEPVRYREIIWVLKS